MFNKTIPAWLSVLAFLCLCYTLQGCAPSKRVELPAHLDLSGLTEAQAVQVLNAADDWFVATGSRADLTGVGGDAVPVVAGDTGSPGAWGRTHVEEGGTYIVIDFAAAGSSAPFVLRHELGHLFGLDHAAGLMSAHDVGRPCIDAAALESFCAAYGCDNDVHSTCEAQ